MSDMGDGFRAHRQHVRENKIRRADKFARSEDFIRAEAKAIGWTLDTGGPDGAWDFENTEAELVIRWWPSSGKTSEGDCFRTWPELKAELIRFARTSEE